MKVYVYKRSFSKEYIRAFYSGDLDVTLMSSAPSYHFLAKLTNSSKLIRLLRKVVTGRSGKFQAPYSWTDVLQSFFAPVFLLFVSKPIILGMSPFSNWIYYMCLLKLLGKKIIYHNSWPYWDALAHPKGIKMRVWTW
ncbi:hypothetical protein GOV10_04020, partial [Candidatus Woesearchaeota archaeon]|nr:hypothetical protein [Candidatus Woesearchaeota archaeon]